MKSNSQALGADIQFGALSKAIANSDTNLSAAIGGSQTLQLQKESQPNLASTSGGHRENWGESNMADGSADTSTDDTEDKNQMVIALLQSNNVKKASSKS
ncbi:TGACG-sequence-specific DNA-binding protein TGA-2.1-like [Trifolium medium]|uniref:TGACG-sequence-specific DNA-binding protein TGA-2.1-like n=1 Tax=Trifolium medium TaxID=97028 RepID=A0A392PI84_9FABA|nr:TGACG-sequence-specific DNA-binding protein TGA-2.1-like [Trifolium medium]